MIGRGCIRGAQRPDRLATLVDRNPYSLSITPILLVNVDKVLQSHT